MLKNFLLVASRSFLRQRFYSFINIFGLSTGLASALFIFLWVKDEVSIDAQFKDSDRLYRVVSNLKMSNGDVLTWTITPGPMGDAIVETVPEVEVVVKTMNQGTHLFQVGDKSFLEPGLYADSTFFKMFDFPILSGSADQLDRSSVAISEKLAKSLFGNQEAVGQVVRVSNKYDLEVKAVFANVERGTSMRFEYILPMDIYRINRGDGFNWGNYDHPLYVKIAKGTSPEEVIRKINDMEDARVEAEEPGTKGNVNFFMVPLKDFYLNSNFVNGKTEGGRIQYVKIFSMVAIFIVLIACINFMNMATARAVQRAKEVGVRKVVGAQRGGLISQFIAESMMTMVISMICAMVIVYALLPVFNQIVSKNIVMDLADPVLVISCVAIVVIAGLVAGSYPAFFLSSYRPAAVLKGTGAAGLRGAFLRKSLVVIQFVITVIMIASAMVVQRQVEYIRNKNVGYDRQSHINFFAYGDVRKRFDAFRAEAEKIPGVQVVSRSDNSLVSVNNQNQSFSWPGRPENDNTFVRTVVCDYGFMEAMGLKLVEGRFFNNAVADTGAYVVTQKMVDLMGVENPIGLKVSQWGHPGEIVGVVEDIHSRSMHEAIDPIVFMYNASYPGRVVVRYDAIKTSEVIAGLQDLAKQFAPDYPFAYTFLDQDFERLYNLEKVTGSLALGFTIIAIIISGLGLLALAAYTAERRKKEISIRKTLGASVTTIVSLMASDFAKLSLIAAVVGCPVAWWLMGLFLSGYAYHMDLTVDIFLITAIVVVVISIATVMFQVAKAAVANPVDALRNE
ncbi:MAG TPA: ABC transporter permease [Cyclobacteriaceae bacterium]|nr:ABC transporter permease [Cyclobacteriaceae bacterium]